MLFRVSFALNLINYTLRPSSEITSSVGYKSIKIQQGTFIFIIRREVKC